MLDKEYEYELYRIEYVVVVYENDISVIYTATFPTKEKAEAHLKEINENYNGKILKRQIPTDLKYALY